LAGDSETGTTPPATYSIGSGTLAVNAEKEFDPAAVLLGQPTEMTLYGQNAAGQPVQRLILIDRSDGSVGPFPNNEVTDSMVRDGVTIVDWGAGITWPSGASSVDVTFEYYNVCTDTPLVLYESLDLVGPWTTPNTLPPVSTF